MTTSTLPSNGRRLVVISYSVRIGRWPNGGQVVTPEQKARQQIDRQLEQAGWIVQDYRQMNIAAGLGVGVREFRLTTGDADYMLYADAKAIGVVEAKPKGHTATGAPA
jgi:type I site-specific restriction endonuclease